MPDDTPQAIQAALPGLPLPPRPTAATVPGIKLATAKDLIEKIIKAGLLEESDREEGAAQIAENATPHMDGYGLMKRLEDRCGWLGGADMVEELDQYAFMLDARVRAAQAEWVTAHNIKPPLPIGTHVTWGHGGRGILDGIYERGPAQYLVRVEGDPAAGPPRNSRRIVNFEDAKPASIIPGTGAPA